MIRELNIAEHLCSPIRINCFKYMLDIFNNINRYEYTYTANSNTYGMLMAYTINQDIPELYKYIYENLPFEHKKAITHLLQSYRRNPVWLKNRDFYEKVGKALYNMNIPY